MLPPKTMACFLSARSQGFIFGLLIHYDLGNARKGSWVVISFRTITFSGSFFVRAGLQSEGFAVLFKRFGPEICENFCIENKIETTDSGNRKCSPSWVVLHDYYFIALLRHFRLND